MKANTPFLFLLLLVSAIACKEAQDPNLTFIEPGQPHRVWLMKNEVVLIEAESVAEDALMKGYWEEIPDSMRGNTGATALIWRGTGNMYRDPLVIDAPKTGHPYKLSYQVMIPEAGEYELKIRNYHWQADGDNDVWVNFNQSIYQKLWDHDPQTWTWSEARANINTYQPYPLEAGINTINVLGRSSNFTIDRLALYRKGTTESKWSAADLPESPLLELKDDKESPATPEDISIQPAPPNAAILNWKPSADNHQVYGYHIYLDSMKSGFTNGSNFHLTALKPGREYIIHMVAEDLAGNLSAPTSAIIYSTPESTSSKYSLQKVAQPITVDANIDDQWERIPDLEIKDPGLKNSKFKIAYNDQYLYFLGVVADNDPSSQPESRDGMELFIDPDQDRTSYFSYQDRIYRFFLNTPKNADGSFSNQVAKINRDEFIDGVQEERKVAKDQFLFEVAIPWKTLGTSPDEGNLIGLEWVIHDSDSSGELHTYAVIQNKSEVPSSPWELGIVQLNSNNL